MLPMAQCHTLVRAYFLLRELRRALSSLPELGSHHAVTSIGETVIFHTGPQCLDDTDKKGIQKHQQREVTHLWAISSQCRYGVVVTRGQWHNL